MATSIGDAWRAACRSIDRLDARLLVQHVAQCTHADLLARPERAFPAAQAECLDELVSRRANGEPLAYLIGSADFFGLTFEVSPAVLIPRPETELLVELALDVLQALPAPEVVDLGTGSGAIAISLKRHCPQASLTAVELSAAALAVARRNADRHAVDIGLVAGDWFEPLEGARFDLIVANPPYVAEGDAHLAENGLPFEPRMALTDGLSGGDGLHCIRTIISQATAHLLADGWVLIEHGYGQAEQVRAALDEQGFVEVGTWRDLSRIERVSGGRLR
ncbi:peptide chain release factor N(5)-glutamine methyltransferase [Accumulibacter sp.]|nr:peptide chain release factor N(5)-glutamine methyltransferase [Accumulibacter sp.]MCM8594153.1 peptide chain release factor N(5)-glutamine methyltransferase [Accumulibacter sp.]MDS4048296.1 peptide chain release factor N(5)-glutamine methyltransferase [Accumulibacter sp.]